IPHEVIHEYMMVGDIAVMPLRPPQCGIGSIPPEFLSLGIPIVAYNAGMLRKVIKNGYNGYVVKLGDLEDMKKKLLFLITHPDKLKEMKINCIQTANEYFSEEI
ncbi:MAG: glycosyltransferase, partial [Candidatus Odinarchaeota archaeon]|nr:glycosyltransferase [Candidatus Odinarchaeota archaeon]